MEKNDSPQKKESEGIRFSDWIGMEPDKSSTSLSLATPTKNPRNKYSPLAGGGALALERHYESSSKDNSPASVHMPSPMRQTLTGKISEKKRENAAVLKAPRIVFRGHTKAVLNASVLSLPNLKPLIVSCGEDKNVIVWSVTTGEMIVCLRGHTARVTSVALYAPNGVNPVVISGSWDETVRVWDLRSCLSDGPVNAVLIEKSAMVLRGHKNRIYSVDAMQLTVSEHVAVSGSADNSIRVWALKSGIQLFKIFDSNATWFLTLKCYHSSMYGPVIVAGCKDNSLRVWPLEPIRDGKLESTPIRVIAGHTSRVESCDVYHNDNDPMIVTTCRDFVIRIFSLTAGELVRNLEGHTSNINSVVVYTCRKEGAIVASASNVGNIRIWKFSTGELLRVFNGHTDICNYVTAFKSPDSADTIIISCSNDQTVRTWLYAEEKSLTVLELGKKIRVTNVLAYASEDDEDSLIITATTDGMLKCWKLDKKQNRGELLYILATLWLIIFFM